MFEFLRRLWINKKHRIPDYISEPISMGEYMRSVLALAADVSVISGVMMYLAQQNCPPWMAITLSVGLCLTPAFVTILVADQFKTMIKSGQARGDKFFRFAFGLIFLAVVSATPAIYGISTYLK